MKKAKYKKVVILGTTHKLKVADFSEFEKELELYKKNPIKYLKQLNK
tara:strand:- start:272 stop:412 length:141 start_codon:yes stop_codon:yes gene_type:complete